VTRLRLLIFFLALPLGSAAFGAQGSGALADLLKSPNPDTRARAAHDIGQSGDASQIPALTATLADPSAKVRKEVVIALARIHAPQSLDGLI